MFKFTKGLLCLSALTFTVATAHAEDLTFNLTIKDHHFTPQELRVPAGRKVLLLVENQDPTPEEFESDELRREKVIKGGATARIFVGPLKPGRYPFFGEFHEKTAQGVLIAE